VGACGRQVMLECAQENERDACAREGANVRAHTRQRIHGHTDAQKLNTDTQTHAHRWDTTLARPSSGEEKPLEAAAPLRCFSAFFTNRRCVFHTHVGNRPATQAHTAGGNNENCKGGQVTCFVSRLGIRLDRRG
jgi:hypothetical protein